MRACVALVLGLVVACGARTSGTELGGEGAESSDTGDPTCRASRVTRASSCAPAECSSDGACGVCRAGEVCAEGRCHRFVGLPVDTPYELLRGLYDEPEGMECAVDADGDLEGVEAAVGAGGEVDAIVMTVYAPCGGRVTKVAEQRRAGSASSRWTIDPPIALKKGGTVRVLFHAEGAKYVAGGGAGVRAGLEAIVMRDSVAGCRFVTEVGRGLPAAASNWDLVGRIVIHPR